ncbi:MAG: DNA polymerase III subunit beta [Alphaproteobacteria bacterium]|nr:DNA polymerase III subunit beta [Alphaproteobacteria bacterium]
MFNISVERNLLLSALSRVQGIVEKRNTIPILSNVLLEAADGQLSLTSTDMDILAKETIAADIQAAGATTVPAHMFYDMIRKLPEGAQVSLLQDAKSGQVHVVSGSVNFSLSYLPAEDFTVLAEGDLSHSFTLPAKQCRALLDKARFAMSTEETRYYLNGIYLHEAKADGNGAVLRSVSTDGHRLARIEIPLPSGAQGMPGVIIPRKAVNELKRILEEHGSDIKVSLSENKILFTVKQTALLSKLIDGTFPDYERVIPSKNEKILEVDAASLIAAVDRVSTISSEKTKGVKLSLAPGKLTLITNSPESGHAEEVIDVSYAADTMEIGFNSRYMLDMLSQLEGDTAQFLLADSTSPALMRDPADVGALYVIMPMRV